MPSCAEDQVAIIGIGCRFPGTVNSTQDLWDLLERGQNTWTEVPAERFNETASYHPDASHPGTHNHRGGHFLTQRIDEFDAQFFNIPAVEAHAIDPQQRLLLETTYEALENGGQTWGGIRGSNTSVYIATFTSDYDRNAYKDPDSLPKYHLTGNGQAIISNRLSYIFDLHGPSMTLDTGCSGSLVALHQACQSLRTSESDMAIVGGVNLILSPDHMISMSNLHMLNNDGKSYSFDARGAGYGRGEGIATIVLKRLIDALENKDPIRAVIRATAINQDGRTAGLTKPSSRAQVELHRSVFANLDLSPQDIGYVEAHGTGTVAGDLAEIEAISEVYQTSPETPLYVGSIKSNVGHLEATSGLAGLIKAIVILENKLIPPNADFGDPKQSLDLAKRGILVQKEPVAWRKPGTARVSINSFGYGGANGVAILEQAPLPAERILDEPDRPDPPYLFVLSADSQSSLKAMLKQLGDWALTQKDYLADLSHTLMSRRSLLSWRFGLVASTHQEVLANLVNNRGMQTMSKSLGSVKIGFVFTGQGAQWYAMGRELYLHCRQYRGSIKTSDAMLGELGATWTLSEELQREESESRIDDSAIAQPAVTALQIALVDLLQEVGVRPQIVIGHSSGEIAAAYAAGIFSHRAAMEIAYHRGAISGICKQRMSPQKGAMIVAEISEADSLRHISQLKQGRVGIACTNSPTSTSISGDEAAIGELQELLDASSIKYWRLPIGLAYHSYHMETVSEEYLKLMNRFGRRLMYDLERGCPSKNIKYISSVTAKEKNSDFGPAYWVENLTSKVRFYEAIGRYCDFSLEGHQRSVNDAHNIMIEIGPLGAFSRIIRQTTQSLPNAFDYTYITTLKRGIDAVRSMLELAGKLFELGAPIDLCATEDLLTPKQERIVLHDLPTYPWDHSTSYWSEPRESKEYRFRRDAKHDLLGSRIPNSTSLEPRWKHYVGIDTLPWLSEHRIGNVIVFPGAAYMCMAIEAARQLHQDLPVGSDHSFVLRDIKFLRQLNVPPSPETIEMQLSLTHPLQSANMVGSLDWEFRITAPAADDTWHLHCTGRMSIEHISRLDQEEQSTTNNQLPSKLAVLNLKPEEHETWGSRQLYTELSTHGNAYGASFAAITSCSKFVAAHQMIADIKVPDIRSKMPAKQMQPHLIHPTILDAIMHSAVPLYIATKGSGPIMPVSIKEVHISSGFPSSPGNCLLISSMLGSDGPRSATFETVTFSNDQGSSSQPIAVISAMELRGFGDENSASTSNLQSLLGSWKPYWKAHPGFPPLAKEINDFASPARKAVFIGTFQDITGYAMGIDYSLRPLLEDNGFSTHITSWELDHTDARAIYIVLDFDQQPLLLTQSKTKFQAITKLVRSEAKVFWVSAPGPQASDIEPERSLITGFARTAHAENEHLSLTTFHVKRSGDLKSSEMFKTLAQAIREAFDVVTKGPLGREREYSYRDGELLIPRLAKGPSFPRLMYQAPTQQRKGERCYNHRDCSLPLETMLHFNASYVVAGGLGDLGQRLSKLMVDRGARHIIALSRRTVAKDIEYNINQELSSIAVGATFRSIACDIADKSQVAALVQRIADEELPPVKGVIQAAVVLHDRTLVNMTLEDFQIPLATKLHGTQNLHNAFSGSHLDFFVTLSSAIGIIGTGGQANYAAGNTFQDAFADSQPISDTHYMSIDIGTVADAKANTEVRNNNLRRAGLIPIESEELLGALEYSMSTEARNSNCKQIVIGFDGNSLLRTKGTNATPQSAMFSEVFEGINTETTTGDATQAAQSSKPESESATETTFQQHTRIVRSITRKLSSLIITGNGEISTNKSLMELGLDSLLAIDLKNWILNEYHVNLSAPAILGQISITALAETVISHLQPANEALSQPTPLSCNSNSAGDITSEHVAGLAKPAAISKASKLPELPLPDLETTLKMFMSSSESFLSPTEYNKTSGAIKNFLKKGGQGQELQRRLQARLEDPSIEHWQSDLYAEEIYLQRRDAVHPFYTFYCGHTVGAASHTQAQRAAVIATTAFGFKQELEAGTLEQDQWNGEPLCMETLQWLFNTSREPGVLVDSMRRYPGNDHMVVLKKWELFKIQLRKDGRNASIQELEATFNAIIARPELNSEYHSFYSSPAALTSDKRNSWARCRLELQRTPQNAASLETIEKAAFIICLDKESPEDPSQRINQFFLGDPQTRWSDKSLQFVVCPNGESAMVCEHTRLDGMSVRSFNRRITDAIRAYQPAKHATKAPLDEDSIANNPLVPNLHFFPPRGINKHRENLSHPFNHNLKQKFELVHSKIASLGASYLRTHKLPSKASYQIILQLAFRLYYGHNPPSWETISVAHFRGGRVDWIQAVTPPVSRFCTAAIDTSVPISQRKSLFHEAVRSHANLAMQISQGHGFKAHLHCLHAALRDGEEEPELFKDQAWLDTRVQAPKQIKTDCLEGTEMQETAFMLKGPDDIFVHYEVEEEQGRYFVQTWPGKTGRFVGCFEKAAEMVRELLEAEG